MSTTTGENSNAAIYAPYIPLYVKPTVDEFSIKKNISIGDFTKFTLPLIRNPDWKINNIGKLFNPGPEWRQLELCFTS